jgi:hypothetical protein
MHPRLYHGLWSAQDQPRRGVKDLPDRAPPGFAELRDEILGFAEGGEGALLQAEGIQDEAREDPTSSLFIVLADEREFPFARPVCAN